MEIKNFEVFLSCILGPSAYHYLFHCWNFFQFHDDPFFLLKNALRVSLHEVYIIQSLVSYGCCRLADVVRKFYFVECRNDIFVGNCHSKPARKTLQNSHVTRSLAYYKKNVRSINVRKLTRAKAFLIYDTAPKDAFSDEGPSTLLFELTNQIPRT